MPGVDDQCDGFGTPCVHSVTPAEPILAGPIRLPSAGDRHLARNRLLPVAQPRSSRAPSHPLGPPKSYRAIGAALALPPLRPHEPRISESVRSGRDEMWEG